MLFVFDVDGTLLCDEMKGMGQYVEGVIPTAILDRLLEQGNCIAIASPSPYYPHKYRDFVFCPFGSNEYRWRNVMDAMIAFDKPKTDTIYIDDLEANRAQLQDWGVRSLSPEAFMSEYANL
jgi:hypothetical protein